ncbi:DUF2169 family type VI secretion system accessory protein [Geoalkalibacter halelectricus]|uniref:DUF2169 domain-containing protein n=1 Tax=Geoalkalibacter halelectricus TaxID=2847045 RepID=A0ABY5ZPJ1_9BACT|nr:DUF2169 domain-containing protein [Geoalkalibacter halelectricus]MDO3379338.1 DUF2169 domain-containing protein [Geoalkalibacter halelectricus]UWZ81090.1 DUF2169 domain-containing protein [Geoalkalibacter halelectricus]
MYQLDNHSAWSAALYPGWSRAGERQFTLVIKAGFSFDSHGRLTPLPQPAIEETDHYRGEPGTSSLAAACETVPFKQGAELLLLGTAQAPGGGRTVGEVEISLQREGGQSWSKVLRVFGRRRWKAKLLMAVPGDPEPLDAVPLIYENAYGGCDPADPEKIFPANPVGRGYSDKGQRLKGLELPQIEIGPRFITGPTTRPVPAGFGPLSPLWEPRLGAFTLLDEAAAQRGGCPWGKEVAADLFNAAPPDQRFAQPFVGGERILLRGLVADAPQGVPLHVPPLLPDVGVNRAGTWERLEVSCDTLVIDADRQELCLVFRAALPWDVKKPQNGWVIVRDPQAPCAEPTSAKEGEVCP